MSINTVVYFDWKTVIYIYVCIYAANGKVSHFCMTDNLDMKATVQTQNTRTDNSPIKGYSNMASFFRFVDKRVIYRWYNLIRTCASECD
jgi:hypothetical protein